MEHQTNESSAADEVNLYAYWKVMLRRKRILLGVFLAIVICTAAANLFMARIYRGEYMVHMASYQYSDLLDRINSNDKSRLKEILPQTCELVDEIELTPLPDTVLYKLKVIINAKDTGDVRRIKDELFGYLVNFPFYKKSVEQKAERLQKELKELNSAISYPEEVLRTYGQLLKSEKLVPIVFNPVDMFNGMAELIKRKTWVEQMLKNHNDLEVITEEIYPDPVKPKFKRNVMLSVLIGILAGVFFSFMAEFAEKIKTPPQNKPE